MNQDEMRRQELRLYERPEVSNSSARQVQNGGDRTLRLMSTAEGLP
jgi:hypothetical protein